ncbi:MAG: hypothetical protein IJY25_05020 [Bacilli bacterium]|nr:hypothetical protein [Bacilli bacterium]
MAYCSECTYLDLTSHDLNGKFWCETRLERHSACDLECYRFCRAYSRSSSEAESAYRYSKEHTDGSGCYLTTMLCNILEMPDDNYYLETMRKFRKNVLQKDEKYKPLLVEYDIVGPKIAEALNNDPLKYQIALKYFNEYIIPVINILRENKNDEAINLYMKMTNSLKNFYNLGNISPTTLEIESADIEKSGHGIYKVKKIAKM